MFTGVSCRRELPSSKGEAKSDGREALMERASGTRGAVPRASCSNGERERASITNGRAIAELCLVLDELTKKNIMKF